MITYSSDYLSGQLSTLYGTPPTSDSYDAAKQTYTGWKPKVLIDRQNPKFVQQASVAATHKGHDVVSNGTYAIRISNNGNTNTLLMERRLLPSGAFSNTLVFRADVRNNTPIRAYRDIGNNCIRYWYITTANDLVSGTVDINGTAEASAPVTIANNVSSFAIVPQDGSGYPVYFTSALTVNVDTALYFKDSGVGPVLLMQWPFPIDSFDAVNVSQNLGSFFDTIHMLVVSAMTAPYFIYSQVSGNTPQKTAQFTGGLFSFLIRPPGYNSRGTKFNIGGPYPIHAFDNFAINSNNNRYALRLSKAVLDDYALFGTTVYLTCIGTDGDLTTGAGANAFFQGIYTYTTRDGKNWSQDHLLAIPSMGSNLYYKYPVVLYSQPGYSGGSVEVYGIGSWATSDGCAYYLNAQPNTSRFDITDAIIELQTDWSSDVRSCSLTINNPGGKYNNTFITNGDASTLRLFMERDGYTYPISVFEVDSINVQRQLPVQTISIAARDRMAWLYDHSTCPDSRQFDNTIIGFDDFADISGKPNTGLAHIAAIAGSLKTASSRLIVQPSYKESIGFSTWKSSVASGAVQSMFDVPTPSGNVGGPYGPAPTSVNAPTYAGVCFRAIDKDNLWYVRWNYWNNLIELISRVNAVDTIQNSVGPGATFNANATNGTGVGIRVEFDLYNITIYICENKTNPVFKQLAITYVINNPVGTPSILTGYTGVIGSGYSDETTNPTELNPSQLVGVVI